MKKQKYQSGKALLILVAILAIALLVTIGVIFYQYIYWKEQSDNKITDTSKISTDNESDATDENTETEALGTGIIEGKLTYPSEYIPESMVIYAQNIDTWKEYSTNEHKTYSTYSIEVPVGNYYVYAVAPEFKDINNVARKAYYDQFVVCGMSVECTDKTKIVVKVEADKITSNITLGDWY